jgi:EAL domain-containing protein (putative c-di-GMP-specific phosphodiesterase class I)
MTASARAAERILEALRTPFNVRGSGVYVSASIGIALGPADDEDPLRDADTAMYRAKAKGGGQFEVFDAEMREQVMTFMRTEHALMEAVARGELRLHYQPILEVGGRIVALEALLRWQHPERGLLAPQEFLPVAEHTGLIVELGEWCLATACKQAREWRAMRGGADVAVSVNLSVRQLQHPELLAHVEGALSASGLPPEALVLEITESLFAEDEPAAAERLKQLKDLGVRLQLDDFGTGYSSLGYLHRFPIEALKIDRSFVASMLTSESTRGVVRSIIALAENLRLGVVGEGVETLEQLRALEALGCEHVQGFLLSRPVEPGAIASLVEEGISAPVLPPQQQT